MKDKSGNLLPGHLKSSSILMGSSSVKDEEGSISLFASIHLSMDSILQSGA